MTGRFSRRVRAYAKAHQIPLIGCGGRKHNLAQTNHDGEAGIISHPGAQGSGTGVGCGEEHHTKAKKPMPYVNHYALLIPDPDWGYITIKIRCPSSVSSAGDGQRKLDLMY
jgi:hypothetical protein